MDWEHKLAALNTLADHKLIMRKPGDWYVAAPIEVGDNSLLYGIYGNGSTPEAAVNDHWKQLVEDLPDNRYLRVRWRDQILYRRWNGFMWGDASHMRM